MDKEFFTDKKVLVMGLGRFGGGVDVVKFLNDNGAEVTVTDLASEEELAESLGQLGGLRAEYHLGGHIDDDFQRADIVVVNPAVTAKNKYVRLARDNGALVTSQIEIFFQLCAALKIGITGAIGKSTTAVLTAKLLKAGIGQEGFGYRKVWLSGNIGNEPMLCVLDEIAEDDLVVLELSSFQIEQLSGGGLAPEVGVLTNLVANHLDRYGTFQSYCKAKEQMFKNQKNSGYRGCVSIFNVDDEIGKQWYESYSKDEGRICIGYSADDASQGLREVFGLPGRANLSNLAGAAAVAKYFGVKEDWMLPFVRDFKALPHRLELVCELDGVRWFNDSKSTTPESAIAGVEAFEEPVILIAGGYDKGLSFNELGKRIAEKTKAAILIGDTAQKIAESVKIATETIEKSIKVEIVNSLEEAVKFANSIAVEGDVVLLSPACASYGQFCNYQQRGEEFVKLVRKIDR